MCGGRNYKDRERVAEVLRQYGSDWDNLNFIPVPHTMTLIHGAAVGADKLAAEVAAELGWAIEPYPAQWDRFGRGSAGPIRNRRMIDQGKPDLVIAFPGGKGTADMVRRAEKAGIPVRRIT